VRSRSTSPKISLREGCFEALCFFGFGVSVKIQYMLSEGKVVSVNGCGPDKADRDGSHAVSLRMLQSEAVADRRHNIAPPSF
jgi:hypothetical protein